MIACISGVIALILSQVTVQTPYNVEIAVDDDYFSFYSWADTITYKVGLSVGDRLEIDLRVTLEDVIFYIKDGYGNEWLRQETNGFVGYWDVPKTGDFFVTLENPYLVYVYPTGYLTLTKRLAAPKYETNYLFGESGYWVLVFVGIFLIILGVFSPLLSQTSRKSYSSFG